jgi:signal peptidase I
VVAPTLRWRSAAGVALQVALLGAFGFAFTVHPSQVSGFSMEPRIDSGEYVIINTLAYRLTTPHRGDIVAFRHERSAESVYLKRVIGTPGDRVKTARGCSATTERTATTRAPGDSSTRRT